MQITFKLFAMLADHLPREYAGRQRDGNSLLLDLPDGTTVADLIGRFALPPKRVHLVLVDGTYVEPQARATRVLRDGEVVAIWPPIAGG